MKQQSLFFIITACLLHCFVHAQSVPHPHHLNFDGQLLDSSSVPITSPTNVTFEIYDGNAATFCLLYKVTQTITPNSYGEFTAKIGPDAEAGHTPSADDGDLPWPQIFSNSGQVRAANSFCPGGYTPPAGHSRKLRVTVASTVLTPDYTIAPVPVANVAETLQGRVANDFLLSNPPAAASNTSVINGNLRTNNNYGVQFTNTSSSNYVSLRAPGALAANYSLTLPMSAGNSGDVLTTDGSGVLSWTAPGGSAVTSVFGRAGIVAALAGDYNASQITSTATGSIAAVNVQAAIAELEAEKVSSGAAGAITTSMIAANAITGALIAPGVVENSDIVSLNINKLTSGAGVYLSYTPNGVSCTNGQILKWDNPNARWDCATDFSLPSQAGNTGRLLKTDGTSPVWSSLVSGLNTAANPALTFASDTTTGILTPAAGELAFATTGTERVRIMNNGNVGIGINAPVSRLDVASSDTTNSTLQLSKIATSTAPTLVINNISSAMNIADFRHNATSVMSVRNTGVGIGTAMPAAKLHVYGSTSSAPLLNLEGTTGINPLIFADSSGAMPLMDLRQSGMTKFFANTSGVGVNTITPMADLDVAGTVKLGTNGTVFSGSGVCTIAATTYAANTPTVVTCPNVPASVAVAVHCSPLAQVVGYVTARANGTINQIEITTGVAAASVGMTCMWMAP